VLQGDYEEKSLSGGGEYLGFYRKRVTTRGREVEIAVLAGTYY